MELKRRLSLVVAILSVALGSGHLVQTVLVKPKNAIAAQAEALPTEIMLVAGETVSDAPLAQGEDSPFADISFSAGETEDLSNSINPQRNYATQSDFAAGAKVVLATARDCPTNLDLRVEPSAMIGVSLLDVCHPNQRVVLRHAGLAVTGKTSAMGSLTALLPAFEVDASVSVRFADGTTVLAKLAVPEAATTRRFGVQWIGDDAFQLNAFENGADYGEIGHVSAAYPQRPLADQAQVGGFLSVLGDDQVKNPMLAEVYTYPAEAEATVRIVIEAANTKKTCARDILGETLADAGGKVTVTDLSLAMPECSAIGDIIVLQNLDADSKLASIN